MKWEGWQMTGASLIIGATITLFVRSIWDRIKEIFKDKWWA